MGIESSVCARHRSQTLFHYFYLLLDNPQHFSSNISYIFDNEISTNYLVCNNYIQTIDSSTSNSALFNPIGTRSLACVGTQVIHSTVFEFNPVTDQFRFSRSGSKWMGEGNIKSISKWLNSQSSR